MEGHCVLQPGSGSELHCAFCPEHELRAPPLLARAPRAAVAHADAPLGSALLPADAAVAKYNLEEMQRAERKVCRVPSAGLGAC